MIVFCTNAWLLCGVILSILLSRRYQADWGDYCSQFTSRYYSYFYSASFRNIWKMLISSLIEVFAHRLHQRYRKREGRALFDHLNLASRRHANCLRCQSLLNVCNESFCKCSSSKIWRVVRVPSGDRVLHAPLPARFGSSEIGHIFCGGVSSRFPWQICSECEDDCTCPWRAFHFCGTAGFPSIAAPVWWFRPWWNFRISPVESLWHGTANPT